MEPERGEALGEWGGGGREGEGGSVAFTDPCAHHKEGGVWCLCLLRGFVLFIFFFCICFYFEIAVTTTITIIIVITAAITIISEENRMQSCHARRTVQHLNNHPHGR